MNIKDATIEILKEAGKPLHAKEITQQIIDKDLWKNNIQSPTVQQVRGSLGVHEQGLIITTSDFSTGAIEEANQPDKTPVGLMNGQQLVNLLMEYNIGVRRMSHDLFELEKLLKE